METLDEEDNGIAQWIMPLMAIIIVAILIFYFAQRVGIMGVNK